MAKAKTASANESKFLTVVEKALDGYLPKDGILSVDWTTGGMSGGSCWNNDPPDCPVEAEAEPEFKDLDTVLEHVCPTITFLQYKKLVSSVVKRDSTHESEYYGNYYTKGIKKVSLTDLENYLIEAGLWEK